MHARAVARLRERISQRRYDTFSSTDLRRVGVLWVSGGILALRTCTTHGCKRSCGSWPSGVTPQKANRRWVRRHIGWIWSSPQLADV
jgi:hypothetical protein